MCVVVQNLTFIIVTISFQKSFSLLIPSGNHVCKLVLLFFIVFIKKIATDALLDLIGCLNSYFARALVCLSDMSFEGVMSDRGE